MKKVQHITSLSQVFMSIFEEVYKDKIQISLRDIIIINHAIVISPHKKIVYKKVDIKIGPDISQYIGLRFHKEVRSCLFNTWKFENSNKHILLYLIQFKKITQYKYHIHFLRWTIFLYSINPHSTWRPGLFQNHVYNKEFLGTFLLWIFLNFQNINVSIF